MTTIERGIEAAPITANKIDPKDATFVGLDPKDLADKPFWQAPLTITEGSGRESKVWLSRDDIKTRGDLVRSLLEFERGPKDGNAILSGSIIGQARTAKAAQENYVLMIDSDTGASLDDVQTVLQRMGLAAVIWNTYSNGKPVSDFSENDVVTFAATQRLRPVDVAGDQVAAVETLRAYMLWKRYRPSVVESVTRVWKTQTEKGVRVFVEHAPMPRVRILVFLKQPFTFATAKATHALGIQDWKEGYAGLCDKLAVDYDHTCVDPSRLMYAPRISSTIDKSEGAARAAGYDIRVIAGDALDFDAVPRVKGAKRDPRSGAGGGSVSALVTAAAAAGVAGPVDAEGREQVPREYIAFLKANPDFDFVGLYEAYEPDTKQDGEALTGVCPNGDSHDNTAPDAPCFKMFPSGGHCHTNTCKTAAARRDNPNKQDRAFYLWKLDEKYSIGFDAMRAFCPTHQHEQRVKVEAADNIKARIAAIAETKSPDPTEVDAVADLIYQTFEEGAVREEAFEALRLGTGKGKGDFKAIRKAAERRHNSQGGHAGQPATTPQDDADVDDMDYSTPLSRDDNGRAHVTRLNFRRAVTQLGVRIWQDVFADDLIIEGLRDCGPEYNDFAEGRLMSLCEERLRLSMTTEKFVRYANDFAFTNRRHPARDYFDKVQEAWDGAPRLDTWAMRYLGVEDTPLNRGMTKTWLVAGPRRIRQPGAKFDEILILESPEQGLSKSAIIELLAVNRRWYVDGIPLGADPKVIMEQTRGILIGEVDELQTSRRADVAQQKSALSRRADRARPAYGRRAQTVDRQFILAGTTNDATYLKDLTGNRRFWPIRIGVTRSIDVEGLTRDLDQLWGEAATYEAANPSPETIRLDKSLWAAAGREQAKRVVDNPFYDQLAHYLAGRTGKISNYTVYTILNLPTGQRGGRAELITAAMTALGWTKRDAIRFGDKALRGYTCGDGIETITADTSGGAITIRVGGKADEPDGGEDGPLLSSFGK